MRKRILWFCCVNTLVAVFLFFILQRSHLLPGDTNTLFYLGPRINKLFNPELSRNLAKDFLIVDTSEDLMLVEKFVQGKNRRHASGNIAITDRNKLTSFFRRLNQAQNLTLVVCNLLFDQDSPVDEALKSEMQQVQHLLIAGARDSTVVRPAFRTLPSGLAEVYTSSGTVSKFRLFEKEGQGTLKSLPLLMAEHTLDTALEPGVFVSRLDGKRLFNDFTLEAFVRSDEVAHFTLGYLTDKELPDHSFRKIVQDKILIIDNLENNTKRTLYNSKTPTSIFLANTYLSIREGSNRFSIPLLITLCIVFAFFSYLVVVPQSRLQSPVFNLPLLGIFLGGAGYLIGFVLIALLLYFVFGTNVNLLYIGLFFYIENLFINRRYHAKRLRRRYNLRGGK